MEFSKASFLYKHSRKGRREKVELDMHTKQNESTETVKIDG